MPDQDELRDAHSSGSGACCRILGAEQDAIAHRCSRAAFLTALGPKKVELTVVVVVLAVLVVVAVLVVASVVVLVVVVVVVAAVPIFFRGPRSDSGAWDP